MKHLLKNVSTNSTLSCGVVNGSAVVTTASTTGLSVGMYVQGTGITTGTQILSVDSATQITLTKKSSTTATENLTFYNQFNHDGAEPLIAVWATSFGGGTVTIQVSPDDGTTWITMKKLLDGSAATYTSNTTDLLEDIAAGYLIRATLTGSTAASNVNCDLGG